MRSVDGKRCDEVWVHPCELCAFMGVVPDPIGHLPLSCVSVCCVCCVLCVMQVPATPLMMPDQQQPQQQQAALAAVGVGSAQQQQQQQLSGVADIPQDALPLPEDARWLAVCRAHAAYLSYMQQLAGMVVSKQQQQHQLVYQVRATRSQLGTLH